MDNVEDIKAELKELSKFLDDGYFGNEPEESQANLVVELVVMKLKQMAS